MFSGNVPFHECGRIWENAVAGFIVFPKNTLRAERERTIDHFFRIYFHINYFLFAADGIYLNS